MRFSCRFHFDIKIMKICVDCLGDGGYVWWRCCGGHVNSVGEYGVGDGLYPSAAYDGNSPMIDMTHNLLSHGLSHLDGGGNCLASTGFLSSDLISQGFLPWCQNPTAHTIAYNRFYCAWLDLLKHGLRY